MSQYHCLVAGLRELLPDADPKGLDAAAVLAEIHESLTAKDRQHLALLRSYHDADNIIRVRSSRTDLSAMGNLDAEQLAGALNDLHLLPDFLAGPIMAYTSDEEGEDEEQTGSFYQALMGSYYAVCEASPCRFIRLWSQADRDIRNLLAAHNARKAGRPASEYIVGGGEVAEAILKSSSPDFGLGSEPDYAEPLRLAFEQGNLLEKERKIDAVRWATLDDITAFNYFDLDQVLSYVVKLGIVDRWMKLNEETGRELLQRMVNEITEIRNAE